MSKVEGKLYRGICDGCGKITTIWPKLKDHTELEAIQQITAGLQYCSKQCLVQYRNKVLGYYAKFVGCKGSIK